MNLIIDIALWSIVLALGAALILRSNSLFIDSLRLAWREFLMLLPRIAIGMVGSGFIAELLPSALIPSWLGADTGTPGLALATLLGALTPGGPVVGFAIATAALKAGAGAPQIIAYTIAWALFALPRLLAFEIPAMPARVVWLRAAVSLPLPFIAAWTAMLVGKP
ncbi:MAG: hypothetical protein QOF14_597 [Hyphomicrobiales bacterium]|jgi:hypothetical protein|nr:hypothetical protein [Hyphomicrobiales bacterium]